jgi:predicted peptidase
MVIAQHGRLREPGSPSRRRARVRQGTVLVLLLAPFLLAGCGMRPQWQLTEGQSPQSFEAQVRKRVGLRFLLFLPAGYARSKQRWPLLIFLHGSGERGDDLEHLKVNGPPRIVATQKDFPFVVASPQLPEGMVWDSDVLNALLDELLAQLKVDPERVYLTGLSLGGHGTWSFAAQHPERFAAIAPISGVGNPDQACRLKGLPIWAFHGAQDTVVPIEGDQKMVDAVRACGGNVEFTVYPDAGHDAWTQTYDNPGLYRWLLQQRRKAASLQAPHV